LNCHKALVFIGLWLLGLSAQAQEVGFTQFYINPALLNPSYVGTEGRPALFLSYRKQWVGIDGSPTTMNFNLQTALPNRVNIGFNASNYELGLVSSSSAMFTGGYTLPLSTDNFLRFGMSVGSAFTRVDAAALNFGTAPGNTSADPLLTDLAGNTVQLIGNLGISYHVKGFHAGIALPSLFQPVYLTSSSFNANFKAFDNLTIHASNRFMLQKGKNAFEPYVVYRMNKGLPGQFEVAALYHYQHLGWVGVSYKQEYGMSGLLGLKLNKIFALGYSYSLPSSGENSIGRASHEIHIAYLFGKTRKEVVQTYSFVNTEIIHKKGKEPQLVVKKDTKPTPPKPQPKPVETKPTPTPTPPPAPAPVLDAQHHEEQEKISRLELHDDNPMETHDETHHPHAERHEFVKRGGHSEEMNLGHYVIAGVFRSEENAKKYSDGLAKMGFPDIDYGYLTEKNLWYVHINGADDINEARQMRDQFRKLRVFRDAWLLTVHE
jgi:type IX secretion system PorP/SprF family membrane protein